MKHILRNCWAKVSRVGMALVCGAALLSTIGCESLQKKFTRKKPYVPASPIVSFQDYAQAMTPLDRYRKHYALFDYWNAELLDALQPRAGAMMLGTASGNVNPKRVKLAAGESLQELQMLQSLLQEGPANALQPLVDERATLTAQLTTGTFSFSQTSTIVRTLEQHSRDIKRDWYWRKVEDLLEAPVPAVAAQAPPPSVSPDASGH